MGNCNASIGVDKQKVIGLRKTLRRRLLKSVGTPPAAKPILERSTIGIESWEPLHPSLWDWKSWKVSNDLALALQQNDITQCVDWIGEDLARIRIFDKHFYERFDQELEHLERWASEHRVELNPPNSMHNYGIELQLLGLDKVVQQFTEHLANSIAKDLFPNIVQQGLDHQHSFFVTYGQNRNKMLGFHADDSEVTFNFCLGGSFVGSELYFQGRRCFQHMQTPHKENEHIEVEQIPGTCIVHTGLHRHGVLPILDGCRRSMIVWTKSSSFRDSFDRERCIEWCGEYTQR